MIRSVTSRRLRTMTRPPSRCFHSTPSRKWDHQVEWYIEQQGAKCYVFHDVFQHVHDFTALPWLASIPLATFLLRALITPVRYYFTLCRRDQRLAEPRLYLAAKIVDTQSAMRLAAGVEDAEESKEWKSKEWQSRRSRIEQGYPRAKIGPLASANTNFDMSNVIAAAMYLVNASTLLSLHSNNLIMFDLGFTDARDLLLTMCSAVIVSSNINYYHGQPPMSFRELKVSLQSQSARSMLTSIQPTYTEWKIFKICGLPLAAAVWLIETPAVIILYTLSHTFYTWVERRVVNAMVDLPPKVDLRPKSAAQTKDWLK